MNEDTSYCVHEEENLLLICFYWFVFKLLPRWPKNCVALFFDLCGFVGVDGFNINLLKLWEKPCVSKFFTAVFELRMPYQ